MCSAGKNEMRLWGDVSIHIVSQRFFGCAAAAFYLNRNKRVAADLILVSTVVCHDRNAAWVQPHICLQNLLQANYACPQRGTH